MIEYDDKAWLPVIFSFHRADTARRLAPLLGLMLLYTTVVAVIVLRFEHSGGFEHWGNVAVMHSLLGFAISTLLVFRTNTAYDRWWEGRRQWGNLINVSRSLAIKLRHLLADHDADRQFFRALIPNFAFVLKNHLRNRVEPADWDPLPGEVALELPTMPRHMPSWVISQLFGRLHALVGKGVLTPEQLLILNPEVQAFSDITGACERIRNTPIPFSYSSFLKKFIVIYCLTLPFGYVMTLHYWVIPVVVFIFYVLASLEQIAEEIEEPFGLDANDLPTDTLAAGIQRVVGEVL